MSSSRCPVLKAYFEKCCAMVEERSRKLGFELWGASLELNSETAEVARVHVHAFVCRHWKHYRDEGWELRSVDLADFDFLEQPPHMQRASRSYIVPSQSRA